RCERTVGPRPRHRRLPCRRRPPGTAHGSWSRGDDRRGGRPPGRQGRAPLAQSDLAAPRRLVRGVVSGMVVDLVQELTAQRLLAIVRGRDARGAAAAACRLVDLGVRLLEVSLSSSGALETIE